MKSLTKWAVVTQMCLSLSAFAEGGSTGIGNGGDTREMRQAELSREQIVEWLQNNGEKLKGQILIQLVQNLSPARITEEWVRESYQTMINGGLLNDIMYSVYDITSPDCQNIGKSAQTTEAPRARICFDVEYLANDGNSIASLAGLALHEHAHHFHINDDGQYRLANYFKYVVIRSDYQQPAMMQFGNADNAIVIEERRVYAGEERGLIQSAANLFCKWQGYKQAQRWAWDRFNLNRPRKRKIWRFDAYNTVPIPTSVTSIYDVPLFTTITCSRD